MGVRPAVLSPSTQVLPVSDGGPVWGAGPKADLREGLEQMPGIGWDVDWGGLSKQVRTPQVFNMLPWFFPRSK